MTAKLNRTLQTGDLGDRRAEILISISQKWGMEYPKASSLLEFGDLSAEELLLIQDHLAIALRRQIEALANH